MALNTIPNSDFPAPRTILVDMEGNPYVAGAGTGEDAQTTLLQDISNKLSVLSGYVDTLEALQTATNGFVDGIEGLLGSTAKTKSISRVITAVTTNIAAGKNSYTVAVIAASSSSSPTLDGVALPVGAVVSFAASQNNTLPSAAIVTAVGDDVLITVVGP